MFFRAPLGSGTFCDVYEGIDCPTGELRAVREQSVNKTDIKEALRVETDAMIKLQSKIGIVKLLDWTNMNDEQTLEKAQNTQ